MKLERGRLDQSLTTMLEEFLGKGAIERAWRRPLFLSKVKTVPKSNGKLTYLGSKPYQPLSEEDLVQNAINPGNEAQHPKWLLDSKGGPAGCVPSRARGEQLQEIPGLHVGLESLPVQCRSVWPFLGPSYIYRHNESSPQSSERQESPRSGLPRRLASVGDFVRGLPKGTGSGATHYEIPRFFNQRGKSSAETVPATCLARSGVGFGTF